MPMLFIGELRNSLIGAVQVTLRPHQQLRLRRVMCVLCEWEYHVRYVFLCHVDLCVAQGPCAVLCDTRECSWS
jgi:hypothetical protein